MIKYKIKRFSILQKKLFTRKEKMAWNQFLRKTRFYKHFPGGNVTDSKTARDLFNLTERLNNGEITKPTNSEKKALKKIGLSHFSKDGVIEDISRKYNPNNPAWERLRRIKGIKENTPSPTKEIVRRYNQNRKKNRNRFEEGLNSQSKEDVKLAKTLKRFFRKHGTIVKESNDNTGSYALKPVILKKEIEYGSKKHLTEKDKSLIKKGKINGGLINIENGSSPEVVGHEFFHTKEPQRKHAAILSPSRKYNNIIENLRCLSEENLVSSRSLEALKNTPGEDRRKKVTASALNGYLEGMQRNLLTK